MRNAATALCDAGPLIALFDPGDTEHGPCRTAFENFGGRLLTTWPVLTEVFHFVDTSTVRRHLWDFVLRGGIFVADLLPEELSRLRALMVKYADLPIDLADASLVVLAERLGLREVFTLDRRHFLVYRPRHVRSFEIMP